MATDLLVLLCVPLTVLLADGGPADGAHVVDAAPLVPGHHQTRHGEPGQLAPPAQQHAALLVMVARLKALQAGVWVRQQTAPEVSTLNKWHFKTNHQKYIYTASINCFQTRQKLRQADTHPDLPVYEYLIWC